MIKLNPLTIKKLRRFRSLKRGYFSFIVFAILVIASFFAELFVNNRAVLVKYEGRLYFPTYGGIIPGKEFGLDYKYETNYRQLHEILEKQRNGNFVLLPFIPYNPYETDFIEGQYPPYPPSFKRRHFLGTDTTGRDVAARLIYGFRIAILFSIILLLVNYSIGISLGCLMGFWGGTFDLVFQRVIEIWSNVPFLYIVIIISSIMIPNFTTLILIMAFFGWMGMTWYMRTATYKEKAREYILAAKAIGASNTRIIFHHIIPNTVSIIVTFVPFAISGGIVSLTSLDYLGFGLPPPTPSWGELLEQGTKNYQEYWIGLSVVGAMVLVLTMVTFTGEAIREAFDPKLHTTYE